MLQPAVIFDMDGVLADTYQPHFESWQRLYEGLGVRYDESDFAADFGRTSRDILRHRLGGDLTDERIREIDEAKESHFREIVRQSSAVAKGAIELIDALCADGFVLGVGSSGPPENVALLLEQIGRADRMGAVVTGADVTRGKPDPQVFLLTAERLGVPPESCVVVEDAVHGIEAAHRAGMRCVAVVGTSPAEQLSQADLVIDNLQEVSPARLRELLRQSSRSVDS